MRSESWRVEGEFGVLLFGGDRSNAGGCLPKSCSLASRRDFLSPTVVAALLPLRAFYLYISIRGFFVGLTKVKRGEGNKVEGAQMSRARVTRVKQPYWGWAEEVFKRGSGTRDLVRFGRVSRGKEKKKRNVYWEL